ncbi:hypothetical protein LTR08_001958 [Meristemomyces frigidus]|nr:hypothetical protein LTR08_001958 [Meristemomyces frigidus]
MAQTQDGASQSVTVASDSCPLLKLAAELRNDIYEMAFTSDDDDGVGVDLETAAGPSKALLLTCRQIYNEARIIHKQAHQRYWQQSLFVVCDGPYGVPEETLANMVSCGEENVNAITRVVSIHRSYSGGLTQTTTYMGGGCWLNETFKSMLQVRASRAIVCRSSYFIGTPKEVVGVWRDTYSDASGLGNTGLGSIEFPVVKVWKLWRDGDRENFDEEMRAIVKRGSAVPMLHQLILRLFEHMLGFNNDWLGWPSLADLLVHGGLV